MRNNTTPVIRELRSLSDPSDQADAINFVNEDRDIGHSIVGPNLEDPDADELVDGLVNVIYADEFSRPDFNQMIQTTLRLLEEHNIRFDNSCRIFVDGANPSFIRALKARVGEDTEYEAQIQRWKSENGANIVTLKWLTDNMFVLPVAFSKYHKEMLAHCKEILEYNNGKMAIHPQFNKLITSLRTAVENDGTLDKEATSHDDLFDSFRMSLQFWH